MTYLAVLLAGLVTLAAVESTFGALKTSITEALQNIDLMAADLNRFNIRWREMPSRLTHQVLQKVRSGCEEGLIRNCMPNKIIELEVCVNREAKYINYVADDIYNGTVQKKWENKFNKLKTILGNPYMHRKEEVNRAIQMVDTTTKFGKLFTDSFYNDLAGFLSSTIGPDARPIVRILTPCLDSFSRK